MMHYIDMSWQGNTDMPLKSGFMPTPWAGLKRNVSLELHTDVSAVARRTRKRFARLSPSLLCQCAIRCQTT